MCKKKLWLFVVSLFFFLGILEFGIRRLTVTNPDGERYFLTWTLTPLVLPVETTRMLLDRYKAQDTSVFVYDERVGWRNRPLWPEHNLAGVRAEREYDLLPSEGVLRVATFGDSFTHGAEVPLKDSWPFLVENHPDVVENRTEIINFGVGGYGLDQAYLTWREFGSDYQPDIVIFGFVVTEVDRLLNISAMIRWSGQQNPFTKPRYTLVDGELTLINYPTVPQNEIVTLIENFPASPLAEYEYFYEPQDYHRRWWSPIYTLSLAKELVEQWFGPRRMFGQPSSEEYELTLAIVEQWATEVEAADSEFVILHMPTYPELVNYHRQDRVSYEMLLNELKKHYTVIETSHHFDPALTADYFKPGGHYSRLGNDLLMNVILDYLFAE